jgi:uncharacterized membrane protein
MTAEETRSEAEIEQGSSPFVEAAYAVREVPFDAPYNWLAAGWRDMWRVPRVSLAYGAIFAVTGLVLAVGLTQVGLQSLILVLAGGFILVGPMLAAGLYETSRRLENGEPVSLASTVACRLLRGRTARPHGASLDADLSRLGRDCVTALHAVPGAAANAAAWRVRFESIAHAAGVGSLDRRHRGRDGSGGDGLRNFGGWGAAADGRACDVVTAALASIRACRKNPKAMALWAALIAGAMLLGFVMLFLGLVIMFPLIGHATWHAFCDLVELGDGS